MGRLTIFAWLLAVFSVKAVAGIVVVVHPENQASLTKKTIKRLYMGKVSKYSTGAESIPINLDEGHPLRKEFDEKILDRSTAQIRGYWSKLVFTGRGIPPKKLDSEREVIELIKQNRSAIGYIHAESVTDDVKVVDIH